MDLSKTQILQYVLKKYENSQNKEYLRKFLDKFERMSEQEFQNFLENHEIFDLSHVNSYVEDFLNGLSSTKYDYKIGSNFERIQNDEKLQSILNDAQNLKDVTPEELSYFVAYRLALILEEDPYRCWDTKEHQIQTYNNPINEQYRGICKSMAELYADMMSKLGIKVNLVRQQLNDPQYAHVDSIVVLDNKIFDVNIIAYIERVKSNKLIKDFGDTKLNYKEYKERIEDIYKMPITTFSEDQIRAYNEKFGFVRKRDKNGKAIYLNDEIDNYINSVKEKIDGLSQEERIQLLPQIIYDYMNYIKMIQFYGENIGIKSKNDIYTSCIGKFIRGLSIYPERDKVQAITDICIFEKNADNKELLKLLKITTMQGTKYYIFSETVNLTEISKKELSKNFESNKLKIVGRNRHMPEENQEERINKFLNYDKEFYKHQEREI